MARNHRPAWPEYAFNDPDGRAADTIVDAVFVIVDTGRFLGAAAATVVGAVTGDEALQAAGVEGLRETGADLGASAASLVVPGLPAPALKAGLKAAEAAGDAAKAAKGGAKAGKAGGPGAGKDFPKSVKDQARAESGDTCMLCGTKTGDTPGPARSEIDHAVPKSRGGSNTIENAQNTCRTCNRQKGAKTTEEFLDK